MNSVLLSDTPRALVTGLRGFTGHYLSQELQAAGYEVFGTAYGEEPLGQGVFAVDLCNREELRKIVELVRPQVVAHLAAVSFVGHGDVDAIYRSNIVGTRNLLEALAGLPEKPRSVLLASSANIYGNAPVELINESVLPAPANDYAVSKLAMEYMARLWMDVLPIVIARPFNYTGVGQSPNFLLPKIVGHFKRCDRLIELGNLDVERDFSDVRMVAKAYAALLSNDFSGEVFNICSGTTYALKDILAMMEEIAGYKIEVKVNPAFVRPNEVKRLQGDGSKLNVAVPHLNMLPMEKTLRWMYDCA